MPGETRTADHMFRKSSVRKHLATPLAEAGHRGMRGYARAARWDRQCVTVLTARARAEVGVVGGVWCNFVSRLELLSGPRAVRAERSEHGARNHPSVWGTPTKQFNEHQFHFTRHGRVRLIASNGPRFFRQGTIDNADVRRTISFEEAFS